MMWLAFASAWLVVSVVVALALGRAIRLGEEAALREHVAAVVAELKHDETPAAPIGTTGVGCDERAPAAG